MKPIGEIVKDRKFFLGVASLIAAAAVYFFLPAECPEAARRTAFVFTLAACFWAMEIMPLWVTSLIVVLLLIFTLGRPGGVLDMKREGYTIFLVPFSSPIIMLFFSGFMLSAAMEKYHIDKELVDRLLRRLGTKPSAILAGFMIATAFVSMWMSNTAATAIMLAISRPVLGLLESDDKFKTALVLSIPFAANIGGIGTPIGTPPNAIAVGLLADKGIHLPFLSWMLMAVPLVVLTLVISGFVLMKLFPPKHDVVNLKLENKHKLDHSSRMVVGIFAVTVLLWVTSEWHKIPEALVALLAVGLLVGFHLLDKKDLREVEWDVLVLMWGGLAIGKAMEVSGLAKWIVTMPIFQQSGNMLIVVMMILGFLLATLMSHTAVANLILPIALSLPTDNPIALAVVTTIATSFAMALPISTPPNAMAFAEGNITSRQMLISGGIIGLISLLILGGGFSFVLPLAFR
jgi:sodium-dependent dicarboxylate transporter 2/3/5